jgi:hypothetical protein
VRLRPFPGGNKILRADGEWCDPPTGSGEPGPQGPQGPPGNDGAPGQQGAQGPQGIQGPPGNDGADGLQGIQGPPGNDGADGAPGTTTWAGITDKPATFTPEVHSHDGVYAAANHNHDAAYEPKNANIQSHVASAHAPSNAQKNSDITKAEIEAKLTGEISSHTHAGGAGSAWTTVKKAGDTGRTNNTLANDPDLAFTMNASTKYAVRGKVFFDTNATADFKWRHVGPALPTLARINRDWIVPGTTAYAGIAVDVAFSAADLAVLTTGTNGGLITFEGIVHVGAAGGTFAFAWAQNTTNVGAATVRAGSYLEYMTV